MGRPTGRVRKATAVPPTDTEERPASRLRARGLDRHSDRIFTWLLAIAGTLVLLILGAMIGRTSADAAPIFLGQGSNYLTGFWNFVTTSGWRPGQSEYGAFSFVFGTLFTSLIAVVIALPLAVGVATYITQIAPERIKTPLSYTVEVLAAVPSVVYGLWGLRYFVPQFLTPVSRFIAGGTDNFLWLGIDVPGLGDFIPIFSADAITTVSYWHAGQVLAIMILPIITAITREIMSATPRTEIEAAYGLGATRWEVIRRVVWPRSIAGITGGTMLGLGRALGETVAVAMLTGAAAGWSFNVFFSGNSMAAQIANTFGEATAENRNALLAIGVALFVITIIVNITARLIVARFGRVTGDAAV